MQINRHVMYSVHQVNSNVGAARFLKQATLMLSTKILTEIVLLSSALGGVNLGNDRIMSVRRLIQKLVLK